ncbi:MAG: histidine phosphatase family protein [Bacteroidetes bacterium]|nr:MAG: histidine phosphatase family protein [Bacteroidota bacterium]
MKTIFFIRHAKSSWDNPGLRDHDRPLNKRGLRDAPFMAKLLKGKVGSVDGILTSSATRALTTARYFQKAFELPDTQFLIEPSIYEAYPEDVFEAIQLCPFEGDRLLVFGHNPTFTTIANYFTDEYISNVPTCGIFRVDSDIESWSDFSRHGGKLTDFFFPKQYF